MNHLFKSLSLMAALILMSACGSSNTPVAAQAVGTGGYYNSAGQFISTSNNGTVNGCMPISSLMSFTATAAVPTSYGTVAGNIPAGTQVSGSYGQVLMGNSNYAANPNSTQYLPHTSANGTLQLYANGASFSSGTINFSPAVLAQLQAAASSNYGNSYPNSYPNNYQNVQAPCVSSMGIWVVDSISGYTSGGTAQIKNVNQALIYLYLSSGQMIGPVAI